MKRILLDQHIGSMYSLLQGVLQNEYSVLPLPKDADLMREVGGYSPDLILLTLSGTEDSALHTYDIIRQLPGMTVRPVIFIHEEGTDVSAASTTPMEEDGLPAQPSVDGDEESLPARLLAIGAAEYITLPVKEELLLHRVHSAIELSELRRERPYVEKYQDAISISFAELVECRDETTGGHLKKTTGYFNILLRAVMNSDRYRNVIAPEDVGALLRSASLHDIGKIGINDEILRKSSPLDYDEFEDMKTHTTLGKQTFDKIINETGGTGWLYMARDIAFCHHERWDGKGYPSGLKGEEIPLFARMLTIADVYDALTSRRAYKAAFTHQQATQTIVDGRGTGFDPNLVDLFLKVNHEFEEMLLENRVSL